MNHTKGVEYWRVISREVLLGIIKHDMGESKFGDVTWDIKQLFPQIETAEANYLHELWGNLLITESYHTGVGVLIDAADCAEGILFCLDEMDLGNTALHLVLTSYKRRLEAAKESLEGLFGVSPLSIDYLLMEAQSRL